MLFIRSMYTIKNYLIYILNFLKNMGFFSNPCKIPDKTEYYIYYPLTNTLILIYI